jgi:outer-membrane receptor for ferric coprogen and ferric-rhodotorulic acid
MLVPLGAAAAEETLDEVTVEGARYYSNVTLGKMPMSQRQMPNSVSVITEQRIQDQNLTTVAAALGNVTGVTAIPNDTSQSQFRSRGYGLSVMYDGLPTYSSLGGYQQFDLAMYDRIEVLRGPVGLLQGASEPGGTVNLVRKRGRDRLGIAAALSAGRWDAYRAVLDVTGPIDPSRRLRGRVVASYDDDDAFTDWTHSAQDMVYGALDWNVTDGTTVSLAAVEQEQRTSSTYSGLPAWASGAQMQLPRSTNPTPGWNRDSTDTREYSMEVVHHFTDAWNLTLRGSRRDQDRFFHDAITYSGVDDVDYMVDFARREYGYDHRRRAADIFLSGAIQLFGRNHAFFAGYNYDSFDSRFAGVSFTAPREIVRVRFDQRHRLNDFSAAYDEGGTTETRQEGFYARARISLMDSLTMIGGARVGDFNVRSRTLPPATATAWRQGDDVDDELTPYGAIVYDFRPWLSMYGSYANTFVSQSTLQRVDGSALEPRTGRQFEVGAKAEFLEGKLNASLAAFDLRDQNRSLRDVANPGFFITAGEVESKGWEMEITGNPGAGFELQAGYSRLDTEYLIALPAQQGQRFSVFEPKHSWRLWAIRRFDVAGLTFGVGCNGQSEVAFDAARRQGGYAVVNAMAAYRMSPHWSLNLNTTNVFDKIYYSRLGGTNTYNTYGEPRSYSLTLHYKLHPPL